MSDFAQMDIFFFIASTGLIIVTILVAGALIYLIALLRDLKRIVARARTEAENLSEDIESLRQNVKEKGFQFAAGIKFFSTIIKRIMKGK